MKRIAGILVALCLAGSLLAGPALTRTESRDGKAAIFSEIAAAVSGVRTIACDFTQEKHLSMLNNILTSKGRFFYKQANKLRWEFNEPMVSGFAVNGEKTYVWKGDAANARPLEIQQAPFIKVFTDQVFAWARADFDKLQVRYRIQVVDDHPVDLKLYPKSSDEKKYLYYIRIVFAPDTSHAQRVEIHEPDGDFTKISFTKMTINGPLPDSLFF